MLAQRATSEGRDGAAWPSLEEKRKRAMKDNLINLLGEYRKGQGKESFDRKTRGTIAGHALNAAPN